MDTEFSNQTHLYNAGKLKRQYQKDKLYAQRADRETNDLNSQNRRLDFICAGSENAHMQQGVTTLSCCSIIQPRVPNLICAQVCNAWHILHTCEGLYKRNNRGPATAEQEKLLDISSILYNQEFCLYFPISVHFSQQYYINGPRSFSAELLPSKFQFVLFVNLTLLQLMRLCSCLS